MSPRPEPLDFPAFLHRIMNGPLVTPEKVTTPEPELYKWTQEQFQTMTETFRVHHSGMTAAPESPRLYCDCEDCSAVREICTAINIVNTLTVMEMGQKIANETSDVMADMFAKVRGRMNTGPFPRSATPRADATDRYCPVCRENH